MIFPDFIKRFPDARKTRDLSQEETDVINGRVAPEFLEFIQQQGLSAYDAGFLQVTYPADFDAIAQSATGSTGASVICHTSFGDLYIASGNAYYSYQSSFHQLTEITTDINFLFDVFLVNTDYADKYLFRDLHAKALVALGPCDYDECYGFVPALPLGGKETVENIQKLKIKEYIAILMQAQT